MPSQYISPFDFRKLLFDYFLGNGTIFAFAFVIIYSLAAAYFQFSNKIYFTLLIIGSIMFGIYLGEGIYILILILTGAFIFKTLANFWS